MSILERIRNPQPRRVNWNRVIWCVLAVQMFVFVVGSCVDYWRGDLLESSISFLTAMVSWVLFEIFSVRADLTDQARDR